MKKVLSIEGMSCKNCSAHAEKALNAIDGVSAEVNLEGKTAAVSLAKEIGDDVLVKAVTDAGYEVVDIQ